MFIDHGQRRISTPLEVQCDAQLRSEKRDEFELRDDLDIALLKERRTSKLAKL